MRVIRGRAPTVDADRAVTTALLDRTAETGTPALRVWTPHRQVAFGRREIRLPGYAAARTVVEERGFPAVERTVGGRAVAYTGTTVAFAHTVAVDDFRRGTGVRYDRAVETVIEALDSLGVDAEPGEPPESFCPGDHSVRAGGKVCGIAQRVRSDTALVAGCLLVDDRPTLVDVLTAVYGALDAPFDPRSLGTVADAGGPSEPGQVIEALESAFVGDDEARIERVERIDGF